MTIENNSGSISCSFFLTGEASTEMRRTTSRTAVTEQKHWQSRTRLLSQLKTGFLRTFLVQRRVLFRSPSKLLVAIMSFWILEEVNLHFMRTCNLEVSA